jgi:PAS domain S-box-containing protein
MDKRFKEINERLIDYSQGKFERRIVLSERKDEIDGLSNGINMLGEELNEALISKNYLNSIFNSVSDMVLILDKTGKIEDVNRAVVENLLYPKHELTGKKIQFICKGDVFISKKIKAGPKPAGSLFNGHPVLCNRNQQLIPVRITLSHFVNASGKELIVFSATNISLEILQENFRLRTVIDVQENERQRFAKDLHDTLIQQLAAIKFLINCNLASIKNKSLLEDLQQSNQLLAIVIKETRNVCFNLMPANLKEFGLVKAVKEYSLLFSKQAVFEITEEVKLPVLSEALKIDLYRTMQELISNSIQHGKADKVIIRFSVVKNIFKMLLQDNGRGFDTQHYTRGMGLQNIQARIKSQSGTFTIQSTLLKGTRFSIAVPLNPNVCLK